MMARTIAGLGGAFAFAVVRSAAAQECPVPQIGQACDAGTCVQATCTDTDVAGSSTIRSCGACVELGPNSCSPEDVGHPCDDAGGVCSPFSEGMGGGSTTGAGPSFQITYSLATCTIPGDATGGGAPGRGVAEADASSVFGIEDDAAAHSQTASGPRAAPGCALSSTRASTLEPLAWGGLAAVLLRRRTKSGACR